VTDTLPLLAARIVIVEDDAEIRRFVRMALEGDGHQVFEAAGWHRGLIDASTRKPDLLILDLGLPDGDGLALIRELRTFSSLPVIVLSARIDEADKVTALDAGADDYLTKPFGSAELLARVRAALRRRVPQAEPVRHFGDVEVQLAARSVSRAGERVPLTPVEFRLLAALLQHEGKVLTHRQLLRDVWGPGRVEQTHYLRVYMGRLRTKLESDPAHPRHLLTETGVGYRFVSS
jgi:two-component system, OmpR family, KDP operon response regulator KdpE